MSAALVSSLEQAGEGSREPFMPTVSLTPDALVKVAGGEVVTWAECQRRLAASTPVGGWEDISTAPKDGTPFYARAQSPYRWQPYKPSSEQYRTGKRGRWQTMTEYGGWENCPEPVGDWKHHPDFAPPPPSVSIDEGSRPQEAVPGEWSERPEVVLQYAQQVATYAAKRVGCVDEWRPLEDVYGCLTQIDNCLTGLSATPQPADGCSSNEGAA